MKYNRPLLIGLMLALFCSPVSTQDKNHNDPKKTLKEVFWGKLYKNGGVTLFCEYNFSKKSVLVTESYIFSTSWMRDVLECGTSRQCRKKDQRYQTMASDLHNIYPAHARFELDRRAAKFEELGELPADECGTKQVFGVIEPRDEVKGDVARAIIYMHHSYGLPIFGDLNQLKSWNRNDPPSKTEIERNNRIKELQGNENIFISNPKRMELIKISTGGA